MGTVAEGAEIPAFDLEDADGARVSAQSLRGRPFVLYFYPKDDTPGCTSEAKDFSALADEFETIGVSVIGVSPDPVKRHAKFRDKHDLRVGLLSDEDAAVATAMGVWVEKSMYGRTYLGVERTTLLVDADGKVRRVWGKVKVPGHAAEVLEAAKALAAGK